MGPVINFVVPYADALVKRLAQGDPDRIVRERGEDAPLLSGGGPAAWCYLTYARLRTRGWGPIRLSNRIDPAAINVAHSNTLGDTPDFARAFFVDTRADHSHRLFAHYTVVQNRDQLAANTAWVHHWPQPGLITRASPVTDLRRIGYIGQVGNNNLAMAAQDWNALLGSHGYEFSAPAADGWHDLSAYDALVAIRSFDASPHSKKPASKLFNAWRAGLPLIAGHDSAYLQVGTPGEDYLVAASPPEVLAALDSLKRDVPLRERIIASGTRQAEQYSDDAIAARWIEMLEGPVASRFACWQAQPLSEGLRARALKLADVGLMQAKASLRRLTGLGPRT